MQPPCLRGLGVVPSIAVRPCLFFIVTLAALGSEAWLPIPDQEAPVVFNKVVGGLGELG